MFIGAMVPDSDTNSSSSSSSSSSSPPPTPTYKWVLIQSIEYDTETEYYDSIWSEVYESFTVPEGCTKWKAHITWNGGNKDSYIKLTMWRYGTTDDVNIGQVFEDSKQGSTDFIYSNIDKGRTYYVEASIINDLYGEIQVYAYVPS